MSKSGFGGKPILFLALVLALALVAACSSDDDGATTSTSAATSAPQQPAASASSLPPTAQADLLQQIGEVSFNSFQKIPLFWLSPEEGYNPEFVSGYFFSVGWQ